MGLTSPTCTYVSVLQESLLLAHLRPKPESKAAADKGGKDSSDDDSRASGGIASDDEDDQLTRLLQVGVGKLMGMHETPKQG